MEKELKYLDRVIAEANRPFLAIVGGAKVSTKVKVIENLLDKIDKLIIGGGMSYTFLKASGKKIGKSICEEDLLEKTKEILDNYKKNGKEIILPVDSIAVTDDIKNVSSAKQVNHDSFDDDLIAVDIGSHTIELFKKEILSSRTVFWNGPMGVFESPEFAAGTDTITKTLALNEDLVTIIGGGDTIAAINQLGLADKMTHVSTGGGASLELLEGRTLPGLAALNDK